MKRLVPMEIAANPYKAAGISDQIVLRVYILAGVVRRSRKPLGL